NSTATRTRFSWLIATESTCTAPCCGHGGAGCPRCPPWSGAGGGRGVIYAHAEEEITMARLSFLPVTAVLTAGALLTSCTGSPEPAPTSAPSPSASASANGTGEPGQEPSSASPSGETTGPATSDLQPVPQHAAPGQSPQPDRGQLPMGD